MEIQTERLCIRTLRPDDWPALKAVFADFRRSPYSVYDAPLPGRGRRSASADGALCGLAAVFAVFLKHSPAMIGYVGFHDDRGNYDLGYCFLSSCQGRGYALEACEALLDALLPALRGKALYSGHRAQKRPLLQAAEEVGIYPVENRSPFLP